MSNKEYLVGIDIGTTGAKTMLFDPEGRVIASAYREYTCVYPKPNWVEQDVDLLIQSAMETSRKAVSQSGINPKEIASISFSTQRTCSLFLDGDGVLVRPMISWQDNRTSEDCAA